MIIIFKKPERELCIINFEIDYTILPQFMETNIDEKNF